jgi:uncharacterized membrane protein YccC
MMRMARAWQWLRHWVSKHAVELRLSLRVTASAVLALALSHLLHLSFALWAILTAVLLTQVSVGQSLKATIDYLASTLGGALYAGAVGAIIPHANEIAVYAALAIAVAPVALVAATNPRFRAAPLTAAMVFMAPTITHTGPIASAFERLTEVAVGGVVGLVVSFFVLPARAQELAIESAARMLGLMADTLPQIFAGFVGERDGTAIRNVQDNIGASLARLNTIFDEAKHERSVRLAHLPDPTPLLRTLLRLRHDLIMIGRAAMLPLPHELQLRLGKMLAAFAESARNYLRANSAALLSRRGPAPLGGVEAALNAYAAEIGMVRREGLTRDLQTDAVERLFALGFTLEQLHHHFADLARCVAEFSRSAKE